MRFAVLCHAIVLLFCATHSFCCACDTPCSTATALGVSCVPPLRAAAICNTLCMAAALAAQRSTCPRPRVHHPTAGAFLQLLSSAPTVDCVPLCLTLNSCSRCAWAWFTRSGSRTRCMAWQHCTGHRLRALRRKTLSNITQSNTVRMYGVSLQQLLNWNSHLCAASSPRTQTRHTPQAAAARLLQLAVAPAHAAAPRCTRCCPWLRVTA